MLTVALLVASNLFMTFAWYGHLKHRDWSLWTAILVSWGIAFFEYCLQVPANRWGYGRFDAYQLKLIQEIIALCIFVGFAVKYLGQAPRWNHLAAFGCVLAAVYFGFLPSR
jgi:uncharacterized protein (DUF486 family)